MNNIKFINLLQLTDARQLSVRTGATNPHRKRFAWVKSKFLLMHIMEYKRSGPGKFPGQRSKNKFLS